MLASYRQLINTLSREAQRRGLKPGDPPITVPVMAYNWVDTVGMDVDTVNVIITYDDEPTWDIIPPGTGWFKLSKDGKLPELYTYSDDNKWVRNGGSSTL